MAALPNVPVNPIRLHALLERQYRRFYDSAYALADPLLAAERTKLMAETGFSTDLLLEPVPGYLSSGLGLHAIAAELELGEDVAAFCAAVMSGNDLYAHQAEALRRYQAGQNPVVSAGTGSGKTESFLLPLFTHLLHESRLWQGAGAESTAWWERSSTFVAGRQGEFGRPAGMRALVLYPMNALVEDQMVRLRRYLDSDNQLAWLSRERAGHRFYFGRYTGQTPNRDLRKVLSRIARRARRAQELGHREHVARPLGAEALTRQDMQAYPPDLLITNFSMLNVMLSRRDENGIFDQTAAYLEEDGARFHLIVDELHTYKGTAGTEVAMLLRRLLHRLGLELDSPKLRVLAASASLGEGGEEARDYLQEFFGVDRASFALVEGAPRSSGDPPDTPISAETAGKLTAAGQAILDGADEAETVAPLDPPALSAAERLAARLAGAARTDTGAPCALPSAELAKALFPDADAEQAKAALAGTLSVLAALPPPEGEPDERLPVRAHLFFRTVPGWWACARADCEAVDPEFASPERRVGKLYAQPTIRCQCGSRCLDLWACETCGDHLLGGYASPDPMSGGWYLLPELLDLESVPEQVFGEQNYGRYRVFWPQPPDNGAPVDDHWDAGGLRLHWAAAELAHPAGRVAPNPGPDANGWLFTITASASSDAALEDVPAIPTRCPNCGDNRELLRQQRGGESVSLKVTDRERMRSSIRRARAGHDRVAQILAEHLLRAVYPDGDQKLVVFSDSRQDAARLNASLDFAHHLDAIRALVVRYLGDAHTRADELRRFQAELDKPPGEADADFVRAMRDRSEAARALLDARSEFASEEDKLRAEQLAARELAAVVLVNSIRDFAFGELLAVGRNPAGPAAGDENWVRLFDWSETPPRAHDPTSEDLLVLREGTLHHIGTVLFSGSGRDVESLGLGLVEPRDPVASPSCLPEAIREECVLGALRVLGLRRFYAPGGRSDRDPDGSTPKALQDWLKAVARRWAADEHELLDWVRDHLPHAGQIAQRWVIRLDRCRVAQPSQSVWICERCGWRHGHGNAGVCQHCRKDLPREPNGTASDLDDYYAELARETGMITRLHTEELTGQTDRADAASRQARFQGIFLGGEEEPPLPSGIDLLSVTTTMELGVDIGSLLAVLMANVPPRRFNYQQRVGRTGRRGDLLSVALTVARERSHDHYYYDRPKLITSEPPPPPYLASDREPIILRVVIAETLRRAFEHVRDTDPDFDPGYNVHGHFSTASAWPRHRSTVNAYIAGDLEHLRSFAGTLLTRARAETTPEELVATAVEDLDGKVTAIAALPNDQPDLSQRLAERGLLPMFGFPTQARHLYTQVPRASDPWPPAGAIDRDLRIAVSEFAPGNEVVVDKYVYRSVGVVGLQPMGGMRPRGLAEPFGQTMPVGLCDVCKNIDEIPGDRCGTCGEEVSYRQVELSFPAGFRSEWRRERNRYSAPVDRLSRASVPRLTVDASKMTEQDVGGLRVRGGETVIYNVNDNHGRCFTFRKGRNGDFFGWLDVEHVPDFVLESDSDPRELALGARLATDVLIAHALAPQTKSFSHCLPERTRPAGLVSTARRAAWTSLAFAFRSAAAAKLDVEPPELETGVRLIRDPASGLLHPEIFLADAIENGAGYVSHLAKPAEFDDLLDQVEGLVDHWDAEHECDTSCHTCLRDYANSSYHPLLDWRLASDAFDILRHGAPRRDRWVRTRVQAVEAAVAAFAPTWACADPQADRPTITTHGPRPLQVIHPLANEDALLQSAEAAVVIADVFNLNRRPGEIYLIA